MLGTSTIVFAMSTFFVLFLLRSAHNIAKGRIVTFISLVAWISLLCGLYIALL
jgi:hypothetical protein